jgi:PAS domain S-box-containing protein
MAKADAGSLLATLDRWSRIGVPDFGADYNKARQANALNIVLMGLLAFIVVSGFGLASMSSTQWIAIGMILSMLTLLLGTRQLMVRGHVRVASRVVIVGLFVIFSMRIALSGGYRSPAGLSYALLCTMAGLLLGWRAAFGALVACGATLLGFVIAEGMGYSAPHILMPNRAVIEVSYITSLMVFVMMLAFAWLRETMDEAVLAELQARAIVEQVRESEARFHLLAESGFEGIAITDAGVVVDKNARLAEILGYQPGELIGKNVIEFVAPEHRERVVQHIQSGSEDAYEHLALHKDGHKVPVEVRGHTMMFRGSKVRITAIRDLTDRYRQEEARIALEERLRQSQKMEAVGQLAGGVAHDFNNLLMMIGTQAELISTERAMSAESRDGVKEILDAVKRASSLTQQLLTLSRRKVVEMTDMDLNESVAHTMKMLRRVIAEDIPIDVRYAPEPLPIRADQSMLEQVLINLAVNARDAIGSGGQIRISTSLQVVDSTLRNMPHAREGSFACLTVTDTGTGIAPDVLKKIFEPFFTTKDVGKGTGLGLATAHGIVTQHAGWISVDSTPGKGSAFRVYLPLATAPNAVPTHRVKLGEVTSAPETVLLTEDEEGVREVLLKGLRQMGHSVVTAHNATAAVEQFDKAEGRVDVLITDIVMPGGMNGWDLARELRSRKPELRVICMSGYSSGVSRPKSAYLEDLTFLQKPFTLESLAEAMRASRKSAAARISDPTDAAAV